ncbi:MAG: hypothetical protein M3281_02855 [Chloroflexota bacterium]|nr:hypothetical protein [Chloroflexota bacterium]
MKVQVLAALFGLGAGGVVWLVWDYINHLKRSIRALQIRVQELEAHNDELVLVLQDRADAARIDEAIRKGHV